MALQGCPSVRGVLGEQDDFAYEILRPRQWIEARSGSLSIYSNAPEGVVRELAVELSLLKSVLGHLTELVPVVEEPPGARIVLFASELGYRYLQPGSTTAAYFFYAFDAPTIVTTAGLEGRASSRRGWIWMPGFSREEAVRRLYHEYVHLLLTSNSRLILPRWYEEGLAELLSTVRFREGKAQVGVLPQREDPEHLAMLDVLTVRNYHDFSGERGERFYARSRALVHMLLGGSMLGLPDRRAPTARYIELLNEGLTEREACRVAFGIDAGQLGEALDAFLASDRIPQWRIEGAMLETAGVDAVRRLSAAETLAILGEIAAEVRGIRAEPAPTFLRASEAADPDAAVVLAWLALWHGAEGRLARAIDYLARADAAGEGADVDEVIARLLILQAGAAEDDLARAALLERAKLRLERGLVEAPDSLAILEILGGAHVLADWDPGPGIEVLERVREAKPWKMAVHLHLAELYRRAGDWPRARERVDTVLHWSGVEVELATARQLSAAIALERVEPGASAP